MSHKGEGKASPVESVTSVSPSLNKNGSNGYRTLAISYVVSYIPSKAPVTGPTENERIWAHPMSLLSGSNAKISEVGRHTHRCIKGKAAGMLNAKSGNHTVFLDLAYKHCHFTLKPIPARHSFPKKASRTPVSLPRRVSTSCKSLGCSAYTGLSTIVSAKVFSRYKCLYCGHI